MKLVEISLVTVNNHQERGKSNPASLGPPASWVQVLILSVSPRGAFSAGPSARSPQPSLKFESPCGVGTAESDGFVL